MLSLDLHIHRLNEKRHSSNESMLTFSRITPGFLPGMLLGVSRSCNVGTQQILKHAIKGPGRTLQRVLSGL